MSEMTAMLLSAPVSLIWCFRANRRHPPLRERPELFPAWRREEYTKKIIAVECATQERGRRWLSGWFLGAKFEDIKVDNVREFLAWAWFNVASYKALHGTEREEVDGIIARLEEKLGPFSPGRGRGVNVMRLNLDATYQRMKIHPFFLVFTLDAVLSRCGSALALHRLGMARERVGALTIWKAGPGRRQYRDDGSTLGRPLIFLHGIGVGAGVYWNLLKALLHSSNSSSQQRPLWVIEIPHISSSGIYMHDVPSAMDHVDAVRSALKEAGFSKADFVAHSYGTFHLTWIIKYAPRICGRVVLCDPISIGMQRAELCRNFLYDPPKQDAASAIQAHIINGGPKLVYTLMRRFWWFENVLWPSDLDALGEEAYIFLSQNDVYIDAELIAEDLARAKCWANVTMWKCAKHGDLCFSKQLWQEVADTFESTRFPAKRVRGPAVCVLLAALVSMTVGDGEVHQLRLHRRGFHVAISALSNGVAVDNLIIDTGSGELIFLSESGGAGDPPGNGTGAAESSAGSGGTALDDATISLSVDLERISFKNVYKVNVAFKLQNYSAASPSFAAPQTSLQGYGARTFVAGTPVGGISLHEWARESGILGLKFPSSEFGGSNETSWTKIMQAHNVQRQVVLIDFEELTLTMGGLTDVQEKAVTWSPPFVQATPWMETPSPISERVNFHIFDMFQLSVCDTNIMANFSSSFPTIVDTGAVCLTLPGELFDNLMAWIPSKCSDRRGSRVCSRAGSADLPTISFQLSETGKKVRIPLQDLVLRNGEYCIRRGQVLDSALSWEMNFAQKHFIVLGTQALRSLGVAFDFEAARVGFMETKRLVDLDLGRDIGSSSSSSSSSSRGGSAAACAKPATCHGQETYYAPSNTCAEPACREFYFRQLSADGLYCEWRASALWMMWIALAVVILITLYQHLVARRARHFFAKTK
eukprot:g1092.t1